MIKKRKSKYIKIERKTLRKTLDKIFLAILGVLFGGGLMYLGIITFIQSGLHHLLTALGMISDLASPHKFYAYVLLTWLTFYLGIVVIKFGFIVWRAFEKAVDEVGKDEKNKV